MPRRETTNVASIGSIEAEELLQGPGEVDGGNREGHGANGTDTRLVSTAKTDTSSESRPRQIDPGSRCSQGGVTISANVY